MEIFIAFYALCPMKQMKKTTSINIFFIFYYKQHLCIKVPGYLSVCLFAGKDLPNHKTDMFPVTIKLLFLGRLTQPSQEKSLKITPATLQCC